MRVFDERPPQDETWIEVASPADIAMAPDGAGLWLKGNDRHSTLILIRAAARKPGPWVAAGLGPRGMAASVAVGAAGISTGEASPEEIERLLATVSDYLQAIRTHNPLHRDPFGIGTPIVQGPMANVTEKTGLARAVAAAGALPFAALGALRPGDAAAVVRDYAALGIAWGAGVIGFDVMPHRDAHLEALRELGEAGPTGVILAGGNPQLGARLTREGLPIWLHTPSPRLAAMALRAGVESIIFEGREAGGHVGRDPSVQLWEQGLAAVESHGSGLVVLAGGIGDQTSAAFAAAMAAPTVRAGARVALQMGTAFLFTHEIREADQVTIAYQQAALRCDETVLVGATVNLPLRCTPNAFALEARSLEQRWLDEGQPRAERRLKLEHRNLGRTRIAAKGIRRNPEHEQGGPRYLRVPVREQIDEGAFSLGQGAAVSDRLQTVAELIGSLTAGVGASTDRVSAVRGAPSERATRPAASVVLGSQSTGNPDAPIAIVGLGCVVPLAFDIETFWSNLLHGVDSVRPIPGVRWAADRYFDPEAGTSGPVKSYARMAGSIQGFQFDPLAFRIPPRVMKTLDPSQRLALDASRQAIVDAGWSSRLDRRRAAVVLGNSMGGEYAKSLALRVRFREVLAALDLDELTESLGDLERMELHDRIEERLAAGLPPVDVDSMPGLLSNVVAGRVASWLDWMGGNLTVDAACAASLAAVSVAVDWLRSGRCDAVLTGGVDTDLSPETFVGFCRTGALSRTGSSPFSVDADGFVMGEGCAVLAMKRLDDALRDGDAVWAVIRGIGQSSDGRGRSITAPRAAGQRLALERAYAEADFGPEVVGMVEAHGTGTSLGDATEVGVLTEYFRRRTDTTWLGSVKSNLGHLKAGAGAAGLTKAVLAVATGTIPPTLHAGPLNPALGLDSGPFQLPRRPVAFSEDVPRASVSAFGFGGTNFHVLLEAPPSEAKRPDALDRLGAMAAACVQPAAVAAWRTEDRTPLVLCYGGATPSALNDRLSRDEPMVPHDAAASEHRVVVVTTPPHRQRDVVRTAAWLDTEPAAFALGRTAFRGVGPAEAVVVLVPGQGAQKPGAWDSVAAHPAGAQALAALCQLGDIEKDGRTPSADPLPLHRSLFAIAVAWSAVLTDAGIPIAATVGHSLGELGALVAAGSLDPAAGMALAEARGRALQACAEGAMVAVEGDVSAIAAAHGVAVAATNAPRRGVLSGPEELISTVPGRRVAVSRAFHSAAVAPAAIALAETLAQTPFSEGLPCYSATSAKPFVDPTLELAAAITATVRFEETARALTGQHLFVELGPGSFLSSCVSDILPGSRCIPLDSTPSETVSAVAAAAALLACGHPGLLESMPGTMAQIGLAYPHPKTATLSLPSFVAVPAEPSSVREAVVAAICEVTGYPADFLDSGADLEADLGVDSIRKMEILGLLQDQLGFTTRESDYAALAEAKIDTIVAHVEARLADPDAEIAPETPVTAHFYGRRLVSIPEAAPGRATPTRYDNLATVDETITDLMKRDFKGPVAVVRKPDIAGAAAAGFVRSLGRELAADVRVITVHPGVSAVRVAAEVAAEDRPEHVTLRPHGTFAEVQTLVRPTAGTFDSPVILATGGTTGIVAACLSALGDLSPRVMILGRRPAEVDHLPFEAAYRSCDLTDPEAVADSVAATRARWGRIDIVLHGAGTLRDGPATTLDEADRIAVFGPKVDGAANLFAATRDEPPRLWVAFSSVVARVGNPGQTLYGAANAVLEEYVHPTAERSVAIPFTAWSEVGMARDPALQALLRSRGIRALTVSEGARAFRRVLLAGGLPNVVTITAQVLPDARATPWPLGPIRALTDDQVSVVVPLDPADDYLDHHQVGGRPLVPAAHWLCAFQQAMQLVDMRAGPTFFDEVAVHAPTFVEACRDDVFATIRRTETGWRGEIFAGDALVAEATLGRCDLDRRTDPPSPLQEARSARSLYRPDLLFHGPHWQVLTAVEDGTNGDARADVVAPDGLRGVAAAVDGAHQLLSMWSGRATGWLGLPVGARRWVVADRVSGSLRITSHARAQNGGVVADIEATDAAGNVVLRGEGITLKPAARWPEAVDG